LRFLKALSLFHGTKKRPQFAGENVRCGTLQLWRTKIWHLGVNVTDEHEKQTD
jgi:hypothetical protein